MSRRGLLFGAAAADGLVVGTTATASRSSTRPPLAPAAFENNDGVRILRRSYNYTDGINQYGLLDAGLLFISYQNDPAHFEMLQAKLGASDALNEYITHNPDLARRRAEQLITALPGCPIPELARLGRTLRAWRPEFLGHSDHPRNHHEQANRRTVAVPSTAVTASVASAISPVNG